MEKFIIPANARSWVPYNSDCDFPIQNLPLGCGFGEDENGEVVSVPLSAIGPYAINLWELAERGLLPSVTPGDSTPWANGVAAIRAIRKELFNLFDAGNTILRDNSEARGAALIPLADVEMGLPMPVTSFVDFYSGVNHAANVGKMFRPDQPPLLPNYKFLPIGYNGRASTVVPTDSAIIRPNGIQKIGEDVVYGPSKELDFELEMGYYVVESTSLGQSFSPANCETLIGGLVLVNDWSARDVQRFEYQPLGPFLAKSFATSAGPWLVSLDALEPFRIEGMSQDPAPLPHLVATAKGHFDLVLEVDLETASGSKSTICRSNMKHLYWSIFQQLAHQTSNGTALEAGDLYATGTISGEAEGTYGSMLELSWKGTTPIQVGDETRTFLEDGDVVIIRAYGQAGGYRVGFGELRGQIAGN